MMWDYDKIALNLSPTVPAPDDKSWSLREMDWNDGCINIIPCFGNHQ